MAKPLLTYSGLIFIIRDLTEFQNVDFLTSFDQQQEKELIRVDGVYERNPNMQSAHGNQVTILEGIGPTDAERQAIDLRTIGAAEIHDEQLVRPGPDHQMAATHTKFKAFPFRQVHIQ